MDLLFNDLSIQGQFPDVATFRVAIGRVMTMRALARRRYGTELQCHRNVAYARVTHDLLMPQVVAGLGRNQQSALMQWLARSGGPFWDDHRQHGEDDWLECKGEVVTDTALGEAAYRLYHGTECGLVSIDPSSWLFSPLSVEWHEGESDKSVDVPNYWDVESLTSALDAEPVSLGSWRDLETVAQTRCPSLTFSPDCFKPLSGHPLGVSAVHALLSRLIVLHDLKNAFDEHGQRTAKGEEIIQTHFAGTEAWFSDSSSTEKATFRRDLTFPHPAKAGETLFCTWHGKVNTPKLRIHFSWPVRVSEPLYVVYVGPKITKR